MSTATGDRLRSWVGVSDARLLLVVSLFIYALFVLVSLLLNNDLNGIANTIRQITFLSAVYAMLVLALNLQWGYAGLFNLGVAGFMAVGVYTMGILSTAPTSSPPGLGLPLPIGILGGILAAALVGVVASLPALRLRGDYLAIVTLGVSEIIRQTYRSGVFEEFAVGGLQIGFGGPSGMALPKNPIRMLFYENPTEIASPPSALGEAVFSTFATFGITGPVVEGLAYAVVLILVVAVIYVLLRRVGNSPFGRVLKAIREDELVASALGKDTRWFKIKVFALGCGLMGLASMLWYMGGIASTTSFRPITTFYVFVALIIGGAGSNTGSVIGGAVFASLLFEGPNFLRRLVTQLLDVGVAPNTLVDAVAPLAQFDVTPLLAYTLSDVNISALRLVLLGVVLIYLIQNRPQGLLGHRKEVASPIDLSERSGGDDS
ncbi:MULTISPECIES: branched-chain amino acid ABC transporter permease [Salinibaculum]|uniref:branched-chain amino acid ABC transporter permease n=1 Tax=Salinibaculum TaxID=2732368 RepID=UPI0030CB96A6